MLCTVWCLRFTAQSTRHTRANKSDNTTNNTPPPPPPPQFPFKGKGSFQREKGSFQRERFFSTVPPPGGGGGGGIVGCVVAFVGARVPCALRCEAQAPDRAEHAYVRKDKDQLWAYACGAQTIF